MFNNNIKLAELHVHVGGSVDTATMWEIAHQQGIRLPTKNYWQFESLITLKGVKKISWQKYLNLFHWTELIQSSPVAMEHSTYQIVSGAYRTNNITTLEISFNPMLRNRGGERDLDQIIMGAIRGVDRATLEFPVKAGLIFMFDRRFPKRLNQIILKKAIQYQNRGVIGVDLAGPREKKFKYEDCQGLYTQAQKAGLGTVVHAGEEGSDEEMGRVINLLNPKRIIHGIKAAYNQNLLDEIKKRNTLLAICPTSNIKTGVVKDISELRFVIKKFLKNKVKFCLNTDGPKMLNTNLKKEYDLLLKNKILNLKQAQTCNQTAHQSTFIQ